MFKVGDRVKLKDGICVECDCPEYEGVVFTVINIVNSNFDDNIFVYCLSEKNEYVHAVIDYWEPSLPYHHFKSFLEVL